MKKKKKMRRNLITPGKNPWNPPTKGGMVSVIYTTTKTITPINMNGAIIVYVSNFNQAVIDACNKINQKHAITKTKLHPCRGTRYSEGQVWALIN